MEGNRKDPSKSIAKRIVSFMGRICIYGFCLFLVVLLVHSYLEARSARRKLETTRNRWQKQYKQLHETNARLKERCHRLKTDPAAVERLMRDKLNLLKPGEYRIVD